MNLEKISLFVLRRSQSLIRCQRSVATVVDGKSIAKRIIQEVKVEVTEWVARGNRTPCLAAVLVGDDPASVAYVRNKMKAADSAGITSKTIRLPGSISERALLQEVQKLNDNAEVDGVLVQLPLPEHISERYVCDAVCPRKDVDGFHVINIGRLCINEPSIVPATPAGIYELIRQIGISTIGKNAVVCGRSKNVGLPIALLLHSDGAGKTAALDATTTICHRYTPNDQLQFFTRHADILVVAAGIPGLITADMVKKGAVVLDVGINYVHDPASGKRRIVGDVDFKGVSEKAGYITPVPGGVGPMTIAMLLKNTLKLARNEIPFVAGIS